MLGGPRGRLPARMPRCSWGDDNRIVLPQAFAPHCCACRPTAAPRDAHQTGCASRRKRPPAATGPARLSRGDLHGGPHSGRRADRRLAGNRRTAPDDRGGGSRPYVSTGHLVRAGRTPDGGALRHRAIGGRRTCSPSSTSVPVKRFGGLRGHRCRAARLPVRIARAIHARMGR